MTTPSFLTVAQGAPCPFAVWTDELDLLAYHDDASLPDSLAALPRWRFTVETSLTPRASVNAGHHPVVDADGRPLWIGCRVSLRLGPAWNSFCDTGHYQGTGQHGTSDLQADHEHPRTDERGIVRPPSRDLVYTTTTFRRDGLLPGSLWLGGAVGSRHELGVTDHYVRLACDPREVCTRQRGGGRKTLRQAA